MNYFIEKVQIMESYETIQISDQVKIKNFKALIQREPSCLKLAIGLNSLFLREVNTPADNYSLLQYKMVIFVPVT
jgi:hypothetical protein